MPQDATRGALRIDLRLSRGDADLFVGASPLTRPRPAAHDHYALSRDGAASLRAPGLAPGEYFVSVVPFEADPAAGEIQAEWEGEAALSAYGDAAAAATAVPAAAAEGRTLGAGDGNAAAGAGAGDGGADVGTCGNCGAAVPLATLPMHEAFCARHNAPCRYPGCGAVLRRGQEGEHVHCEACGEAMPQRAMRKHVARAHAAHACPCGAQLALPDVAAHRREQCPRRTTRCRFCGAPSRAGQPPGA